MCQKQPRTVRYPFFSDTCARMCACVCVEGRSQAWVFVMSSLGSFWFNCSSPLFHAVLLSNSSGLVTTVLSPSFSTSSLHTRVHFFYFLVTPSVHSLLMGASSSAVVTRKIQMLTIERGGSRGRSMHEWPLLAHTIHSSQEREQPLSAAPRLTPVPPQTLWYDRA